MAREKEEAERMAELARSEEAAESYDPESVGFDEPEEFIRHNNGNI